MSLLSFLVGQFYCMNNDVASLITQARVSRSTVWREVGPLHEKFRVLVDEDDVLEDAPVPRSTDRFLVYYGKLCSCCIFVKFHPSLFFSQDFALPSPFFYSHFYRLSKA